MATGNWKLSIKRRDSSLFESMIFPKQMDTNTLGVEVKKNIDSTTSTISPTARNQKLKRRMECDLFLDDDGTFTLMPPFIYPNVQSFQQTTRQPLTGHWHLNPNPYCVTDRQYDKLILESIPKIRIYEDDVNDSKKERDKDVVKEKITIEMSCNVWGRFGSNSIRRLMRKPTGKSAGRLTHGKLSIVKVTSGQVGGNSSIGKIQRVLCATFRARHQ
eukprot:CAMPEP_0176505570 /NCGR_PEP_ID=MMETSP0200_2-20121128/16571_1 /TAXON_ID=947934 /ORGANISM="Chaetoceros sp., Strain GSL56" /LENGTH=215 /DNA_ID=CAMNT_0017905145 /DNA_START=301 /DNA_END=951 /DNA_ORIENTATION=-